MVGRVLGFCPAVNAYGEGDLPYFYQEGHPRYLRLVQWPHMKMLLEREKTPFTLLKPLYDSQLAKDLLTFFPGSRAIWIFRHYLDVVDSHIKNYKGVHDGIIYTRELFDRRKTVWKNENLPDAVIEILEIFRDREINSATGYALFWLARNSLYAYVKQSPDVLLVNYEAIVLNPVEEFSKMFSFLGVPFKKKYASVVHSRSYRKPVNFVIDPEVQGLCEDMYKELKKMMR